VLGELDVEVVFSETDDFYTGIKQLSRELQVTVAFLQTILNRHTGLQGMQVAQTAACNRLHDIQQRLARWLLMTQDRVHSGVLPITHDFIATMMGTDRSTVSLAASVMQKKGIIDYIRGEVKVLNCRKLERSARECYDVIQQFEDDLGLR
jgi:CRP-like cAMP-binding protein